MRSVSSRNFWGGCWGGFLGILTTAYIAAWLLPVGCIAGVIGGFYYQEVARVFVDSWRGTVELYRQRINSTRQVLGKVAACFKPKVAVSLFCGLIKSGCYQVSRPFRWVAGIKIRPTKSHPLVWAKWATFFAIITFLLANSLWLVDHVMPGFYVTAEYEPGAGDILKVILLLVAFVMCLLMPVFIRLLRDVDFSTRFASLRYKHGVNAVICRRGFLGYFITETLGLFRMEVGLMLAATLMVLYLALVALPFLVLTFLPITLFVLLVRGIYHIITQKAHWLCLGTTLTVTIASAWMFYPHLAGVSLWLIAFGTGIVSGGASELLRRATAFLFQWSPKAFNLATFKLSIFLRWPIDRIDAVTNYLGAQMNRRLSFFLADLDL